MKVHELIAKLKSIDQNIDIICYTEDDNQLPPGHTFKIFEIESLEVTEGEKVKGEDEVPSIKFGKSNYSQSHAIISITSDF
jgi:hypothetical protein